ncbi:VanZ family protein [Priestia taiwanensis]|uniref:VanZ-like domain-containing protein n=1 Tax=Priestia taiwanensis TaxID=1347902 RepID=A0A917AMC6_9BACI|nr:VanZ family protein [Priestia taiwanensis]MBM7362137.1 glycopeptide antibiotics resistance protein [Priestia taiwanensis]GGE59749.1 hypothetical protein GCM10007140_07600 [Priestia taiwanensis]
MKQLYKIGPPIALGIYLLILTKLVLLKYVSIFDVISRFNELKQAGINSGSTNFVPFRTIHSYLFRDNLPTYISFENIVGNIIGFMPFGFLLPVLFKKMLCATKIMIATFLLSLIYEVLQYILILGSFDVDDLILNTLGGLLGYISLRFVQRMIRNKKQRAHTLNR